MKKTRELVKKIRGTKIIFPQKGTRKDRKGKDLTEAEVMKKRWKEYTEELYRKGPNNPDTHDSMTTHLESGFRDIDHLGSQFKK